MYFIYLSDPVAIIFNSVYLSLAVAMWLRSAVLRLRCATWLRFRYEIRLSLSFDKNNHDNIICGFYCAFSKTRNYVITYTNSKKEIQTNVNESFVDEFLVST